MLCSRCSMPIRPVVAVDIDGTLGNYHQHFFKFMEGYLARRPLLGFGAETYQGDEPFGDFTCNAFNTTKEIFRDGKLAYRQGGMKRNMPVFPDARALMTTLSKMCELWVTTTRPYLRLDNIDPDTRFWLDQNKIPYHCLLFQNDKYQVLADQVDRRRVVAILDDLKENLDPAAELFGEHVPIQYGTTYNRAARFTPYVSNHTESIMAIRKRITDWKKVVHGQKGQ